jgi:2-keto-3-deoxy-L-rhamnonate aldolase RhmA
MIDLMASNKPVFGLYAPSPPRVGRGGRGGRGGQPGAAPPAAPAPETPPPSQADLARQARAYAQADFIFNGSMEGGLDRGLPAFLEFAAALSEAGSLSRTPFLHLTHPLVVKTPSIAEDKAMAGANISQQLNAGASGLMFVTVETADEARLGIAAMRFRSRGGTRPDDVGAAPAIWGMSEDEYREKADLWPLNPNGELINWTIVESHEGLAHVREIATVPGIGVLWPGAGTLRGLFMTTNDQGERVRDEVAWEAAIQKVLAACKEFDVPCGYPANENDIEERMRQGFSVFVMNWGDAGFRTVEIGRKAAGR